MILYGFLQSGKFGKLNKTIKFPEILDLAPYMSGTSDKSPVYRLYGVVVHLDIMNAAFSGHYVCYVKNAQNKWFKLDDSSVCVTALLLSVFCSLFSQHVYFKRKVVILALPAISKWNLLLVLGV